MKLSFYDVIHFITALYALLGIIAFFYIIYGQSDSGSKLMGAIVLFAGVLAPGTVLYCSIKRAYSKDQAELERFREDEKRRDWGLHDTSGRLWVLHRDALAELGDENSN